MSSGPNWQEEAMRRLRQMQQTSGGRGGGMPPRLPRGSGTAAIAGTLMLVGGLFVSNALFNVDGGHRAIKYRRLSGVSKDIYSEGTNSHTGSLGRAGSEATERENKC